MEKNKILLVVTNFNQCFEIEKFLHELGRYWPKRQTLIVDDCSTDGSDRIAENLGWRIHRNSQNLGNGAGIRIGVQVANQTGYKAILLMSSNGKMLSSDIEKVVSPIMLGHADYVTGSRYISGGNSPGLSLFRRFCIPLLSAFYAVLLGRYFTDISCGFRCYKIDFLVSGPANLNQDWLNRYEMEYYIHYWACRTGLKVVEVPVTIRYDHLGKTRKSKIKPIVGWWSIVRPLFFLKLRIKE